MSSSIVGTPDCGMRKIDGGERHFHHVELLGERLDDHPEAVQVVSEEAFAQCGTGEVETSLTKVRHRGDLLDRDLVFGGPLDCLEHPVLARFCQRDGDALSTGTAHPPNPVDVGVHRGGHVVVDDMGELFYVEATCGDVGGDEEVGGPAPQAPHHPVPLLLAHSAVQGLRAVAAAVECLGQTVDCLSGSAEHECRGRRLDVEDPPEGGRFVGALDDVGGVPYPGRLIAAAYLVDDADAGRVAEVLTRDGIDAAWGASPKRAPSGGSVASRQRSPQDPRQSPCPASRRLRRGPSPGATPAAACRRRR